MFLLILCLFSFGCGNGNASLQHPELKLTSQDKVPVLNTEWVDWIWSLAMDSSTSSDSAAIGELYVALANALPVGEFDIRNFSDSNFTSSPFITGYRENLDGDTAREWIFVAGGLAHSSLLFVLKSEGSNCRMIFHSEESSFYENSVITFLNCGNFKIFETVSEAGGTTDIGMREHRIYRLVEGKVHSVLNAREIVDISGTLKGKTTINLLPRDSTGNEDGIIVHYNACYWLCNAYDSEHLSPKGEENWDLYRNGTCDLAEGVVLLNKRYGLLYSWSPDSLKYLPVYAPYGITKEQHRILENVNSSEDYAQAFFLNFRSDIHANARRVSATLEWLDKRFEN